MKQVLPNHTSQKLGTLEINPRQFLVFRQIFAETAEPFRFAPCLEAALPFFSKLCSDIA